MVHTRRHPSLGTPGVCGSLQVGCPSSRVSGGPLVQTFSPNRSRPLRFLVFRIEDPASTFVTSTLPFPVLGAGDLPRPATGPGRYSTGPTFTIPFSPTYLVGTVRSVLSVLSVCLSSFTGYLLDSFLSRTQWCFEDVPCLRGSSPSLRFHSNFGLGPTTLLPTLVFVVFSSPVLLLFVVSVLYVR